jgi:hypothetical protein
MEKASDVCDREAAGEIKKSPGAYIKEIEAIDKLIRTHTRRYESP